MELRQQQLLLAINLCLVDHLVTMQTIVDTKMNTMTSTTTTMIIITVSVYVDIAITIDLMYITTQDLTTGMMTIITIRSLIIIMV
jgi:hypothetical protein